MAKRGRGHRSIQGGRKNFAQPDRRILRRTARLKIAFQIPFAATMLAQTFVERVSLVLFPFDLPAPLLRVCILCVRVCMCMSFARFYGLVSLAGSVNDGSRCLHGQFSQRVSSTWESNVNPQLCVPTDRGSLLEDLDSCGIVNTAVPAYPRQIASHSSPNFRIFQFFREVFC